jgi:hypothetical protein
MLQQTRVAAVIEHYNEFVRRFPTLVSLALAEEADVLAAWSGLGYYRRARMLHKAAQFIMLEREGRLPAQFGGAADSARDWRLHRGGDCQHRVWRGRCRGGWQRGAGDSAADGRPTRRLRLRPGVRPHQAQALMPEAPGQTDSRRAMRPRPPGCAGAGRGTRASASRWLPARTRPRLPGATAPIRT